MGFVLFDGREEGGGLCGTCCTAQCLEEGGEGKHVCFVFWGGGREGGREGGEGGREARVRLVRYGI